MAVDTVFSKFPHRMDESIVDTPDIILDRAADELMIRGQYTGRLIKDRSETKLKAKPEAVAWMDSNANPVHVSLNVSWETVRTLGPQVCALGAIGLANGLTPESLDNLGSGIDSNLPGINELRSEEHTSELQSPDHLVCR